MIALQGYAIGPAGLEPPAGARNRRKATVKNTKNRPLGSVATKGTMPNLREYPQDASPPKMKWR